MRGCVHARAVHQPSAQGGASPLERMMSTNFTACVRSVSCCLPALLSTGDACTAGGSIGASIVLISSMARYSAAVPGMGAYFASKYALHGYAGALLEEVRHHNVRVSCVCPGMCSRPCPTCPWLLNATLYLHPPGGWLRLRLVPRHCQH